MPRITLRGVLFKKTSRIILRLIGDTLNILRLEIRELSNNTSRVSLRDVLFQKTSQISLRGQNTFWSL